MAEILSLLKASVESPTGDNLHALARAVAADLRDPDKKQLRFNEIVSAAERFYPSNPAGGVMELVRACDRNCPALYAKGRPMWQVLHNEYAWMA